MPNQLLGETPLALKDGRELVLVLDFEALIEAESAYGKPMARMMADALQDFVGANRALFYGALRAKHPQVTLREAGAILQSDGDAVVQALTGAIQAGFPEPEQTEEREGANPRGKSSGASGAKPGSSQRTSGGRRPKPSD